MKKTFIIIVLCCNLACILYLFHRTVKPDTVVNVAACLPVKTVKGQMMLNGINLYLSELAWENPQLRRKIKLQVYDDKNDLETAAHLAGQIGADNTITAVLGHNTNTAAISAGKIYKRFDLIAVTGSATATDVTRSNEWYFSVVPNDEYQAAVMAAFIRSRTEKVAIIQEESGEKAYLTRTFERVAKQMGIAVTGKWQFTSNTQLNDIIRKIDLQKAPPGFILLNTGWENAAEIMKALGHRKDLNFIGPATLAHRGFIDETVLSASTDQQSKGRYLDRLYTVVPFFTDPLDNRPDGFRRRYHQKFNHDPSWESACYYDAMKLLAHAIGGTVFQVSDNILEKRKKFRETLNGYRSSDQSVNGITGNLYFNRDGCVERPYIIGQYVNGVFFPAFVQYHEADGFCEQDLENVLKGKAVWINNILMHKKQIIYCGIKVNAVEHVDFDGSGFTADFYLWFRFTGDFNESDIFFPDALTPVSLDKPVWEQTKDGIKTRGFRIKATFKNYFNFFSFPFGRHCLNIHLQHQHSIGMNNFVYLKDCLGMPKAVRKGTGEAAFDSDSAWRVLAVNSFRDTVTHISTLGVPDNAIHPAVISSSRFNADILIAYRNLFFPLVYVLPLFLAIGLSGSVAYFGVENLSRSFIFLSASLVIALMNHIWLAGRVRVNYVMLMEYLLFGFYALVIGSGVIQIQKYRLWQRGQTQQAMFLSNLLKVVYPLVNLIGLGWMIYYNR